MSGQRCVVVGDVIGSRAVEDRPSLKATIEAGVEAVNEQLGERLAAPFAVLKGVDEVGGVLRGLSGAYEALRILAEAIHPVEIRFAIVWGTVDVGLDADSVAEMDGPAFHAADHTLDRVERAGRYVGLSLDGPPTTGASTWTVESTLENLIDLLFLWKSEWTERQTELVGRYREAETMAAVAEDVGVSVQSVSKTLDRAGAGTVLSIETDIRAALEHLDRERQ